MDDKIFSSFEEEGSTFEPARLAVSSDPLGLSSPPPPPPPTSNSGRSQTLDGHQQFEILRQKFLQLFSSREYVTALQYFIDALPLIYEYPREYLLGFTAKIYCRLCLKDARGIESDFESIKSFDSDYWRYETHPTLYPNKRGSMIPFSLQLYRAAYQSLCGTSEASLKELFDLLSTYCDEYDMLVNLGNDAKINKEEGSNFGNETIESTSSVLLTNLTITAHLIAELLWNDAFANEALELLQEVLSRHPQSYPTISLMGRICLMMGDIDTAWKYFKLVQTICSADSPLLYQNAGLLGIAKNDYVKALRSFEDAIYVEKGVLDSSPHDRSSPHSLLHSPTSVGIATNNVAVALVYNANSAAATFQLSEYFLDHQREPLYSTALKNIQQLYHFSSDYASNNQQLIDFVTANLKEDIVLQVLLS